MQRRDCNTKGLDLIKFSEGFYSKVYKCPAGVWTIGIGTTYYPNDERAPAGLQGKRVGPFDPPCTLEQAYSWLNYELDQKEDEVNNWLVKNNVQLNDNQFSALVSFAYNLGSGPITAGDSTLSLALKSGKRERIESAFKLYVKAKNKWGFKVTLPGLVKRRENELKLFFS
nr:lysozyme [Bacteriovorax sp. HI3]